MTALARIPRWWRADDTGSMPVALLVTVVGMWLTAMVVTPMVVNQIESTRGDARRTAALQAAQAGLDVAMGHLRAASDGDGNGVLTLLPCGPLAGSVDGDGDARYQVSITYLSAEPQGRDDAWLAANAMTCQPDHGPPTTPAYVLLRSVGTAGTGATAISRSLRGTYTLQTTNRNIAGGLIHAYKMATSKDLCLDAGSAAPADGSDVQMQPCAAGRLSQMFAYNRDLTVVLVSSKTAALPLGMCLDAAPATQRGAVVEFRPCGATTLPRQQWSINDSANFQGTTNGTALNGLCFNVQRPDVIGSFVVLGSCGGPYNNTWTFSADAAVGAGAAGKDAGQLVNFNQFGRCMDVTKHDVNYPYMIIWPCKQAPDPARVSWNQKWAITPVDPADPAKGALITTRPNVLYCLRSPGSTRAGAYVTVARCNTAPTADMIWKVSGDTGNYATSYVAVDFNGLCLAATDPKARPADLHFEGEQVSKAVVSVCDGSTLQKWNAPANILQTLPLKDISEK